MNRDNGFADEEEAEESRFRFEDYLQRMESIYRFGLTCLLDNVRFVTSHPGRVVEHTMNASGRDSVKVDNLHTMLHSESDHKFSLHVNGMVFDCAEPMVRLRPKQGPFVLDTRSACTGLWVGDLSVELRGTVDDQVFRVAGVVFDDAAAVAARTIVMRQQVVEKTHGKENVTSASVFGSSSVQTDVVSSACHPQQSLEASSAASPPSSLLL
jgi:hypothetical protein